MSATEEIKTRLDVVDVIGQYIPLKKSGRNYKALCPFHTEKTPSFVVFPDTQSWRCFGACGEGGDIFNFVMKQEGWDFPQALRHLANMAGVELEAPTTYQKEARETEDRLHHLLAEAALYFNDWLYNADAAAYARRYVEERGLTADTIRDFQIGYAPPGWETTLAYLLSLGYERQDLIDTGLVVVKDDGGIYDRFRNRLIIPIHNLNGDVAGFGARALDAEAVPKYLNSPQSPVFDKSTLLFGLSQARRAIRDRETAIIVEGYMDVLQAHQAGFSNVIAQMGTALTEAQLKQLSRYASRLILALDADEAGQRATDRGREAIERVSKAAAEQAAGDGVWDFDSAERDYHARLTTEFDPRGMVRYESRLGFDIRVILLPEGHDPDDIIRETPDLWVDLVEGALPVVEYAIQAATAERDLNDPKVKSQAAGEIVPLINDIANPVERSHYRQRLARLLKVDERALFTTNRPAPPPQQPARLAYPEEIPVEVAEPRLTTVTPTHSREAFCLAALIRYPRLLYLINRVLAEYLQPDRLPRVNHDDMAQGGRLTILAQRVVNDDFIHPEHRVIFAAWQHALAQDDSDPLTYLLQSLDDVTRARVDKMLDRPLYAILRQSQPPGQDMAFERILEAALQGLLDLRMSRLDERIQEIQFLLSELEDGGALGVVDDWDGNLAILLIAAKNRIKQARDRHSMAGKRAAAIELKMMHEAFP